MANSPPQLEYARSPGWRGKRFRYAIILVATVLAMIASLKFVGPAWTHLRMLRYQHQCMNHVDPAGTLAVQWDPRTGNLRAMRISALGVNEWKQFYTLFSPPGRHRFLTMFVHGLKRKDGAARLVVIEMYPPMAEMASPRLDSTVIEPGGLFTQPQLRSSGSWYTPFQLSMDQRGLQLFAGQGDPTNASHFTIAFKYGQHAGTIDGWLQDDDSILFELREPLPAL